ncbi:MAG: alpha/beta hydrolase, partial [Anaerolineae bacterium]|nr:alpha/beta hydrolase [Anaerolineae bacterium]
MQTLRTHGSAPYTIAVIHGGPGAPGSAAPIARGLADMWGVLEPFQTVGTLDGQIAELRTVLHDHATRPTILIGWSWGAMLSYVFAARHPDRVKALILVGSGVFDAQVAPQIMETRLSRLSDTERDGVAALMEQLNQDDLAQKTRDRALARFGRLLKLRADTFAPVDDAESDGADNPPIQFDIHNRVWNDMAALRQSGELLQLGTRITCPVIAIHGDYDPHPLAGIQTPLATVLSDFEVHVLERCGHYPWIERHAR